MESRFYDQLPQAGKDLVYGIECYSGKFIAVVQKPGSPSCGVDQRNATITFPDVDAIPADAAVHELLHIHRNWPERIPRLVAAGGAADPLSGGISNIDNEIEHILMSLRQKALGFDPTAHWNQRLTAIWQRRNWERIPDERNRRLNLLQGAVTVEFLATDQALRRQVEEILRAQNILQEKHRFVEDLKRGVASKESAVACTVHHLQIPKNIVCLYLLDVKTESVVRSDVADWH